jgi:hypothetical protein
MSLNDIKLSGLAVDELYKDALLYPPAGAPASPAANPSIAAPTPPPAKPAPETAKPSPALTQPTKPASTKPALEAPDPTPYKFLGDNRRQVAILVHSPGAAFLPDEELAFLIRILEACRMTIADIAIVNSASAPVDIASLRQQLHPKTILLFGLSPTAIRLPIDFPVFRLQPYDDCTYLATPPLHQLTSTSEDSRLLKSKLWVCLKTLFEV